MLSKVIKGGVRTVRLQAPDVRKLNDAAFTLKQIAAGLGDDVKDEKEELTNAAEGLRIVVERYTEKKAAPPAPKK